MTRRLGGALLLAALICAGCGEREQPVELGAVENIKGLVGASSPRSGEPPKLVAGFSPPLPASLAKQLEESPQVRVMVRVIVDRDGRPIGAKVTEVKPADSDAAGRYAELVSAAVWKWEYRPGLDGRGVLDLTFEP